MPVKHCPLPRSVFNLHHLFFFIIFFWHKGTEVDTHEWAWVRQWQLPTINHTFTVYIYTRTFIVHVCYNFCHLGMRSGVWSAVVMGMGLCARSNPLSIHLFCSPASHCAPRLNRPGKKIWTCDCNVIQNKTTALTGRFFFLTSKQNLCSRSFRVNVWMEVNACTVCVCVCLSVLPSLLFLFLELTDCEVKSDLTEVLLI